MNGIQILERLQCLQKGGDFSGAITLAKSALPALTPDDATAMRKFIAVLSVAVGNAAEGLSMLGDDESENALLLRARAEIQLGNFDVAAAHCAKAIKLYPGSTAARTTIVYGRTAANSAGSQFGTTFDAFMAKHDLLSVEQRGEVNVSHEYLRAGHLDIGFTKMFKVMAQARGADHKAIGRTVPQWNGGHVGRLLLFCYEGIGDVLQFARYISAARHRCAHLTIVAPSCLVGFLSKNLTADQVIPSYSDTAAIQTADALSSLFELPYLLKKFDYGDVPYLTAESAFHKEGRKQVGLCWKSSPSGANMGRTCDLNDFQPFAALDGIDFHSLVPGKGSEWMQIYQPADYEATARIVAGLDLIITTDTGVAHLCGAMGKPTWILLNKNPCWRWETHPTESKWYPTARLYRKQPGELYSSQVQRAFSDLVEAR